MRSLLTITLLALLSVAQAQGTNMPRALQFSRTVNVPLSRAQVVALVDDAWANSFALDPGARLGPVSTDGGTFEGSARIVFRSAMLTAREQTAGNIHYRVTVLAENGSCQVRVTHISHSGSTAAKGGAISLGTVQEEAPADLRLAGLSRPNAATLHNEVRDVATARINLLLGRFESTLRERAAP